MLSLLFNCGHNTDLRPSHWRDPKVLQDHIHAFSWIPHISGPHPGWTPDPAEAVESHTDALAHPDQRHENPEGWPTGLRHFLQAPSSSSRVSRLRPVLRTARGTGTQRDGPTHFFLKPTTYFLLGLVQKEWCCGFSLLLQHTELF